MCKMNLTKNFTLAELIKTNTGLKNEPNMEQICNLKALCEKVLQPARDVLGLPITVTSGFRSLAVNRHAGGSATSDHLHGRSADLVCANNKRLFDILRQRGNFDQLIHEHGTDQQPQWVHVSHRQSGNRGQVFRAKKVNGRTVYIPI